MLGSRSVSLLTVGKGVRESYTPPPFYDNLDETLRECWRLLSDGVTNRRSAFHTPTLASVREDGSPTARTIVLRALNPEHRTLRFHTDLRSSKSHEIAAEPRVTLHIYDRERKIQLRIEGLASMHAYDNAAVDAWRATRPFSRLCYRALPGPGSKLGDPRDIEVRPDAHDPEDGWENFLAVSVRIDAIEWLYLSARGHRRARFQWHDTDFTANWLVP